MKRKTFLKSVISFVCAVALICVNVLGLLGNPMTVKAAGTTLILHYGGREDNSYDNWNLWMWEEGADGQAVNFRGEDEFGKIAIYQSTNAPKKIGFIVRKGDWEAKDVETDRFVEISGETTEVWVTSGVEEFSYEVPEGCASYDFAGEEQDRLKAYDKEGALKLNVHYYKEDKNYKNTEALGWQDENAPGTYPMVSTDDFGAVFHVGILEEAMTDTYGVNIYNDGNADTKSGRKIDLTKAVDKVLDVYLVEGKTEVYYTKEDVNFDPAVLLAEFNQDTTKQIEVELSKAVDTSLEETAKLFSVKDEAGNSYEILKLWNDNPGLNTQTKIILKEELALEHTYTVGCEGYTEKTVGINKAFSSQAFEEKFTYEGEDLGAAYSAEKTVFKVWAPTAEQVKLNLYKEGEGDCLTESVDMKADVNGTWVYEAAGDRKGVYYTYTVKVNGEEKEAVDPYAKAVGVNGNRGMVVDLAQTNPEGFEKDKRVTLENKTDAVIYELHVRDLSSDASSGISKEHQGKFLGLTETGTTNKDGLATGLDHIKDLGVTHVHLLPSFDYATVDESVENSTQFNWGYDPKNYNVPEGSYATNAADGAVRVKEFKEMVQTLHENGLGVVMDVVYNHTFNTDDSSFQKIVPDYYYRMNENGYSNASGCGNETASERSMMRKFMVDSVVYWAKEYHVDGFRFDLMGIHDIETMKEIRKALDEIDPSIIIYGEGWTGGDSTLDETKRAVKKNISLVEGVAAFSDDIRDGIKGNVFDALDQGFVNGGEGMENAIRYSVLGATQNDQVDYDSYEKSKGAWAGNPTQTINYVSCHDNLTIWDKLATSNPDDSKEDRVKMNELAAAICFTSQGIPFIQAGEEMLRSKPLEDGGVSENSYNLPDYTNSLKWDTKAENMEVYNYYKGLIDLRKANPAFRLTTTEAVQDSIQFQDTDQKQLVAYTIDDKESGESVYVAYNASKEERTLTLPEGKWHVYVQGNTAGTQVLDTVSEKVTISPISATVLVKAGTESKGTVSSANNNIVIYIVVGVVVVLLIILLLYRMKKSKKRVVNDYTSR